MNQIHPSADDSTESDIFINNQSDHDTFMRKHVYRFYAFFKTVFHYVIPITTKKENEIYFSTIFEPNKNGVVPPLLPQEGEDMTNQMISANGKPRVSKSEFERIITEKVSRLLHEVYEQNRHQELIRPLISERELEDKYRSELTSYFKNFYVIIN